ALFFYDYLLTFSQEVICVWQRPKHGAAVLFLMNRYVVFFNRLIRLVNTISWRNETEYNANMVLFGSLRIYTVWGKNPKLSACVLFLGLAYPIVLTVCYPPTLNVS
ncbi:hypothetical protein BDW22DRAFT_1327634, partial [Trametopsis cervina]